MLAVIRHADRTPKQKLKMKISHHCILDFFKGNDPEKQVKLKSTVELKKFIEALNEIIDEEKKHTTMDEETFSKILEAQSVMLEKGEIRGINRKIQIKPLSWKYVSLLGHLYFILFYFILFYFILFYFITRLFVCLSISVYVH